MTDSQKISGETGRKLCGEWGYWLSADPEAVALRAAGVQVAGPCKRPAFHEGGHSLDAAHTASSEQVDR